MTNNEVPLDTLAMRVKPLHMGGLAHHQEEGSEYTVFELHLLINGINLINVDSNDEELIAVDDRQIWLAQRYNRRSWVLTCTCGTPGCAGFYEPVATSRAGGRLTWTFPPCYFDRLRARGLVSGSARATTFVFDAREVYEQFHAAQEVVRHHEAQSGQASAFSAGCYGKPVHHLDSQYEQAEAWYLKRTKHRRYARHTGTKAGVCAGAPLADRSRNVE